MVLIFAGVNLYLGSRFFRQFKEFRLKNGPISIEGFAETPIYLAGQADIDNDGEIDVILTRHHVPDKFEFLGFGFQGKSIKQVTADRIIAHESCLFLDAYYNKKSGTCVFRFLKCDRSGLRLVEITGEKEEKVLRFENPGMRFYKEEGRGFAAVLVDLEEDGKKEMVLHIRTDYNKYPRGLVCYDMESGELLWQYYCGTQVMEFEFKDLDGDNRKEVILSTAGINNGAEMNGTSDAYSYVIVLDSNGKEIWKQKTGGWYTAASSDIADLENDGIFEIITAVSCHRVNCENRGKIFVFDGKTGGKKAHYFNPGASFSSPIACKINKDETRVYTGDSTGIIWMFDPGLKLIRKEKVEAAFPARVLDSSWSSGHGKVPYIFVITDTKILAYDGDIDSKLFEHTFEQPLPHWDNLILKKCFPDKTRQNSLYIPHNNKLYHLSESKRSFALFLKNMIKANILYPFIFFIIFNGIFFYFVLHFKLPLYPSSAKFQVIEMPRFFEILQGIAHQVKNPISTILWTAEKMKRSSTADEDEISNNTLRRLSDFLLDDVKTLQDQANNMLKLIRVQRPLMKQLDIKSFFEKTITRFRTGITGGKKIIFKIEEDIFICADEELLKEAIIDILNHALKAVPEGGGLTILVSIRRPFLKRKRALIRIEDTGPGRCGRELIKIFNPFCTTIEKGMDIGPVISKHVIRVHGGKIKIYNRKNSWTGVDLLLPLKKCHPGQKDAFSAYIGIGSEKKDG